MKKKQIMIQRLMKRRQSTKEMKKAKRKKTKDHPMFGTISGGKARHQPTLLGLCVVLWTALGTIPERKPAMASMAAQDTRLSAKTPKRKKKRLKQRLFFRYFFNVQNS